MSPEEGVVPSKTKTKTSKKHNSEQSTSNSKKNKKSEDHKSKNVAKKRSQGGSSHSDTVKPKNPKETRQSLSDDEHQYNHIVRMKKELSQQSEAMKYTLSRLNALEKEFSKRVSSEKNETDSPEAAELLALRKEMKKFEDMGQAQMAQMASLHRNKDADAPDGDVDNHDKSDNEDTADAAPIVDVHARPSEEFDQPLHYPTKSESSRQSEPRNEGNEEKESKVSVKRAISPIEWDRKSEEDDDEVTTAEEKSEERTEARKVDNDQGNDNEIDNVSEIIVEPVRDREPSPQPIKRVRREEYSAPVSYAQYENHAVSPPPRQPPLISHLFKETRYFMIKSNNYENVSLAKAKKVWSTPHGNEARLNQAYYDSRSVLLIFSVKESGKFQGYARLAGPSDHRGPRIHWSLPPNMNPRMLSGVFPLDWISR